MLILKINNQGIIKLPGVSERRTPAEIDISKCNINSILIELRKYGINDFVIENKNDNRKPTNIKYKKSEEKSNPVKNKNVKLNEKKDNKNIEKLGEDNLEMKNKINNIEKLLQNLIDNRDDKNIKIETEPNYKDDEDDEDDYIPEIDLSGMKLNK